MKIPTKEVEVDIFLPLWHSHFLLNRREPSRAKSTVFLGRNTAAARGGFCISGLGSRDGYHQENQIRGF